MAKNKAKLPNDDEIDLREIINLLIEFKKLIISSILIFTIASIIYSLSLKPSFETSAILEIGYTELDNGDRELLELTSNLISDLNIFLLKRIDSKFNQKVSMKPFENKLIILETTSKSTKKNEDILTEMINYIHERHSNLAALSTNQKKGEISQELNLLESEISFNNSQNLLNLANVESQISLLKKSLKVEFEAKILKLQNDLPILDQEINQLNQVIIEETNNLNLVKNSSLSIERAANSPTLEQIISNYKSTVNELKMERNSNILEISILSQNLDALKKYTLHSDALFELEKEKSALENYSADQLFNLQQRKKTLENELKTLISQDTVKTQPIADIKTRTMKSKTPLFISLGIIIGIIIGVFLAFIIDHRKNYIDSKV